MRHFLLHILVACIVISFCSCTSGDDDGRPALDVTFGIIVHDVSVIRFKSFASQISHLISTLPNTYSTEVLYAFVGSGDDDSMILAMESVSSRTKGKSLGYSNNISSAVLMVANNSCGSTIVYVSSRVDVDGDVINHLMNAFTLRPRAGLVGPVILKQDGSIFSIGYDIMSGNVPDTSSYSSYTRTGPAPHAVSRMHGMPMTYKGASYTSNVTAVHWLLFAVRRDVVMRMVNVTNGADSTNMTMMMASTMDYRRSLFDVSLGIRIREAGYDVLAGTDFGTIMTDYEVVYDVIDHVMLLSHHGKTLTALLNASLVPMTSNLSLTWALECNALEPLVMIKALEGKVKQRITSSNTEGCIKLLGDAGATVYELEMVTRLHDIKYDDKYDNHVVILWGHARRFDGLLLMATLDARPVYVIGRTSDAHSAVTAAIATETSQPNAIWVPSKFNIKTFNASNVPREKLELVHDSVDTNLYHSRVWAFGGRNRWPKIKPLTSRQSEPGDPYRFLVMGPEGVDAAISAYLSSFDGNDEVSMIVYSPYIPHVNVTGYISKLSPIQLPMLFSSANCLVMPVSGAGYVLLIENVMYRTGGHLLKAGASGIKTIMTNFSALPEYSTPSQTIVLDYKLVPTISDPDVYVADPSLESLRKALMRMSTSALSDDSAHYVSTFSADVIVKDILERLLSPLQVNMPTIRSMAEEKWRSEVRFDSMWNNGKTGDSAIVKQIIDADVQGMIDELSVLTDELRVKRVENRDVVGNDRDASGTRGKTVKLIIR